MNKKTIIQLVIIVVAFGAAGLILYNGFFSNNGSPPQLGTVTGPGGTFQSASKSPSQSILPYGSSLDFSKALDIKRFQYNQIEYPRLDPQNDVGILPNNLIVPTPAGSQSAP